MKLEDLLQATQEKQASMFRAMNCRNYLLTKINGIDLWIYDVETKLFHVMFRDGSGNVLSSSHPILDYDETTDEESNAGRPLTRESQKRWNDLLYRLSIDPSMPEEGYIDLDYKNYLRRIRSHYTVTKDTKGNIEYVSGTSEDISKTQEHMQSVIERQNEYIRIINGLKSTFDSIFYINITDYSFRFLEGTMEMRNLAEQQTNALGYIKKLSSKLVLPEHQNRLAILRNPEELKAKLKSGSSISIEFQNIDNIWIKLRIHPAEYTAQGDLTHVILTTEVVDEEHKTLDQLKMRSEHDGLTGIYNRAAGVALIEDLMHKESGILALFDCDKFKLINDSFGHLVGDKVLIIVAQTLQKVFEGQVVFRLGGDEFVCYLQQSFIDRKAKEGLKTIDIFKQLREELQKVDIPEMCGQCPSASFGVARSDKDHLIEFDELYKTADISLYQCKKYGRNDLHKMLRALAKMLKTE